MVEEETNETVKEEEVKEEAEKPVEPLTE